eukprot:3433228-Rhodomonas_salina.1
MSPRDYDLKLPDPFPTGRKNWEEYDGVVVGSLMDEHLGWFVDVALALFGTMQKSLDPATAKLFAAVSAPADSDPAG